MSDAYGSLLRFKPIHIQPVPAEGTVDLRHAVLRTGHARDEAIFAGDHDADTLHLGAVNSDGAVIGVAEVLWDNGGVA